MKRGELIWSYIVIFVGKWVKAAMEVGRLTMQDGCSIGGRWLDPGGKRVKGAISLF